MNYLKVYCNLIRKAENRVIPEGYTEKHHVFPKSIFGDNKRIVVLTAREHYIAHALLEKICIQRYGKDDDRTKKMTYSFWGMNNQRKEKRYFSSHLYETSRERFIKILSEKQKGKNNSMYGKTGEECPFYGQSHTEETKQKLSEIFTEKWKNQKHPWIGRKHSEESKAKIGESNKGNTHSKESKEKISESKKGNTHSEKTKAKMRESQRKRRLKEKAQKPCDS